MSNRIEAWRAAAEPEPKQEPPPDITITDLREVAKRKMVMVQLHVRRTKPPGLRGTIKLPVIDGSGKRRRGPDSSSDHEAIKQGPQHWVAWWRTQDIRAWLASHDAKRKSA